MRVPVTTSLRLFSIVVEDPATPIANVIPETPHKMTKIVEALI